MALPAIALFEDFLEGVRVSADEPASGPAEMVQRSAGFVRGPGSEVWLAYPTGALQLDSVLAKISEGLRAAGSPSSRAVAIAVLAMVAGTKGATRHVEHANQLIGEMRPAELSLNFVSPSPPPTLDIRADYGTVKVEPFDPGKLEYWAERGHASWPVSLRDTRGRIACASRLRGLNLLNVDRLPGLSRLSRNWSGQEQTLLDPYYQAVLRVLQEQLQNETTQRLGLAEAAGIVGFDLSAMTQWSVGIHLFTWAQYRESKAGCWAVYHQPSLLMNTPPAEIWRDAKRWLIGEFGVDNIAGNDRPIDLVAQTFTSLVQDARAHHAEGRIRESFLYFVIALDQLLGEDGRNVSTVADRTSVLTHRFRAKTFAEESACVRRVYDARSRLVHSGSPAKEEDLHEAEALARAVLWSITRVVTGGEFTTRDAWVNKVDALAHVLRGDPELVTPERLTAVGATSAFRVGPPPPVLRDRGPIRSG